MKRIRAKIAYDFATPPREIRLWRCGENPTDYGVHVWSERSRRLIMAEYERRGNPLAIDVEHGMASEHASDGAEPPRCAGIAHLSLRNGEPWLSFEWSEFGAEQIATRERRFLSPEYLVDQNTGEITALIRVSLVASPGTHFAQILASRKETNMEPMAVIAALQEALSGEGSPDEKLGHVESLLSAFATVADVASDGDAVEASDEEVEASDEEVEASEDDAPEVQASSDEGDEENKVAAAAAPKRVHSPERKSVKAAAAALAEIRAAADDAKRDLLLASKRAEVVPAPVRATLATLPLSVVEKVLASYPPPPAKRQERPTVGGQGSELTARQRIAAAAPGSQLHTMAMQMRALPVQAPKPHRAASGALVMPMRTPTQIRAAVAAESKEQN